MIWEAAVAQVEKAESGINGDDEESASLLRMGTEKYDCMVDHQCCTVSVQSMC
jgi:hypothetical protein